MVRWFFVSMESLLGRFSTGRWSRLLWLLETGSSYLISLVSGMLDKRRTLTALCPGFGKSDKYTDPSHYTHELHCLVLRKLLDHLQLKDITLVCQDW